MPCACQRSTAAEVATGKPDGAIIVLTPLSTLVIQPQILDLRFKTPDDYELIINVVTYYPLLVVFQNSRHPAFPDSPTAKALDRDVANGVWFLLMAPKRTPAPAIRVIPDAARAAMEVPSFKAAMDLRGIDVDFRPGHNVRADLWREYKAHTVILKRIGLIKQRRVIKWRPTPESTAKVPVTPLHMGLALAIKAVACRRFSLLVFGFSQVAMDMKPLVRIVLRNRAPRAEPFVAGYSWTHCP